MRVVSIQFILLIHFFKIKKTALSSCGLRHTTQASDSQKYLIVTCFEKYDVYQVLNCLFSDFYRTQS